MENETFIFCLEAVNDVEINRATEVVNGLEKLAFVHGVSSIYKACDTIEGLEESLGALVYEDHNFTDYEIIYLVVPGQDNMICLHDYYYSLEEIAELFEGKLKGKIVHFSNIKALDLTSEESQYFLDVTGARAISGYGISLPPTMTSMQLDIAFFRLCQEEDDLVDIVEELHQKHYEACRLLDFRLYRTA